MSTETSEREVINVWWIKSAGPKGGRPIERPMRVDGAGLKALLETLPPCDRVRIKNEAGESEEFAGQGGRDAGSVQALVPMLTEEQLATEFLRRENVAVIEDMGRMRRAFTEGTLESLKIMRAQLDTAQAMHEKLADLADKQTDKENGDLVDKIISGLVGQLTGNSAALGSLLRSRS